MFVRNKYVLPYLFDTASQSEKIWIRRHGSSLRLPNTKSGSTETTCSCSRASSAGIAAPSASLRPTARCNGKSIFTGESNSSDDRVSRAQYRRNSARPNYSPCHGLRSQPTAADTGLQPFLYAAEPLRYGSRIRALPRLICGAEARYATIKQREYQVGKAKVTHFTPRSSKQPFWREI